MLKTRKSTCHMLSNWPFQIPGFRAFLRSFTKRLPALGLVFCTLALNIAGIGWGLPGRASWDYDSIAGLKTVRMIPSLFGPWRGERYPRGHFLITGNLYKPLIRKWRSQEGGILRDVYTGKVVADVSTGKPLNMWDDPLRHSSRIPEEQISLLILVSRLITVLMAIGAVLGTYAVTRMISRDTTAALFAGMVLMFSPEFNYYSHVGNLDVPVTFWFVWTAFFSVRALQTGMTASFLLAGLFAGITVCTKDPSIGHLIGLTAFVVIAAVLRRSPFSEVCSDESPPFPKIGFIFALAGFAAVFIVMNDLTTDIEAFKTRMVHWAQVKNAYRGPEATQWQLIADALRSLYMDLGPWMIMGTVAALCFCARKQPLIFIWAIAPMVMFHLTITTHALQVQPRYHLPSLVCLATAVGVFARHWICDLSLPKMARVAVPMILFSLQAVAAITVSAEMSNDSRYRAEAWIRSNLKPDRDSLTFLSPELFMPRADRDGFRVAYRLSGAKELRTDETVLADGPKLIVLSEGWYGDALYFDQGFRTRLLGETLGYRKIVEIGPKAYGCSFPLFQIANFGLQRNHFLSPKIVFMVKSVEPVHSRGRPSEGGAHR